MTSLGAINKLTGAYVYPKIANKKDHYICPECNKDLIIVKGNIRAHHFRHKVDSINPCHNYSNPSETQIHKDAKMLLKYLLESKEPITFVRNCCCCKKNEEFEIPEVTETSAIYLEHRFKYNGLKIADVAYLDGGEIVSIFEICNTHKTLSENRPEPWFEIDAETVIKMANNTTLTSLKIPCIRCEKCDDCIERENALENHIRVKLGQTIFPTPYPKPCENDTCGIYCNECDNCKYDDWYYDIWKPEGHLRFDFDATCNITNNKKIMELFNDDFINKKVVIHTRCSDRCAYGSVTAYIIPNSSYDKYNYWDYRQCQKMVEKKCFPCEKIIDFSDDPTSTSTISIIMQLIKYCQSAN
jgi:hypothetical protein